MEIKKSDYFEAIIQLRNPSEELLNFVENRVEERENVFVSNIKEVKNGYDIYISDQRYARSMGRKMKKAFKGELKTSRSLYGVDNQTSKKVYRVTVCFRMPKNDTP